MNYFSMHQIMLVGVLFLCSIIQVLNASRSLEDAIKQAQEKISKSFVLPI